MINYNLQISITKVDIYKKNYYNFQIQIDEKTTLL